MRDLGVLFSASMVRALLAGTKTVTRRLCPVQPVFVSGAWQCLYPWGEGGHGIYETEAELRGEFDRILLKRAPWKVGRNIWVRETWRPKFEVGQGRTGADQVAITYAADGETRYVARAAGALIGWNMPKAALVGLVPGIHMPRWATRLERVIASVRVERVQDITEEDARAEGISQVTFIPDDGFPPSLGYMVGNDDGEKPLAPSAREAFRWLWNELNGKRVINAAGRVASWKENPFVYRVAFEPVQAKERAA